MNLYDLSSYDYNLPENLIAQNPHEPADECKMLYFNKGNIKDLIFKDIINLIGDNDVLFFNNSKVIKARITGDSDKKGNIFKIFSRYGGEKECKNCEILFLRKLENNIFEALVRPGRKFKVGTKIKVINNNFEYCFEVLDYTEEGRKIKYLGNNDIFEVLDKIGKMPLPPYIEYSREKENPYQPIQAKKEGSVASPTASLHFTEGLFKKLKDKGVDFMESTLHIGMGTFKTVNVDNIKNYDIHSELVEVPVNIFAKLSKIKENGKNIISVGTTSTRILESLPYLYNKLKKDYPDIYKEIKNKYFDNLSIDDKNIEKFIDGQVLLDNNIIYFNTKLFIYPGFKYNLVDKLITNFHLPKSSLLMLVSAFMGYENMMKAYNHAINNKYKFFSFGDAMFIDPN